MKRVMIFIGLKVAEVIGVIVVIYGIFLLVDLIPIESYSLLGEVLLWICGAALAIIVVVLTAGWVIANWEWATKLSKKGK